MKRIFLFLCAAMLTAQAWAQTTYFTVGNLTYDVTDETKRYVSVGSRGSAPPTGTLNIPEKVTNPNNNVEYTVTSIRGFQECSGLTSVTIPNSVTSIGSDAFSNCTSLTSVTIPNSVTSIGNRAFFNCTILTAVSIGNSVTSIGYDAFFDCSSLAEINVEKKNTQYASENGILFNKGKTTIVCYPEGKTETTYTIPNSVTRIGDAAFRNCTNLTTVTIPRTVTNIGNSAFYHVKNITYSGNATGKPWGALTVNGIIDGDFIYSNNAKTNLTAYIGNECNVIIPNSVRSIGSDAFSNCTSLKSVTIPNSVTSIGSGAFYHVKNITYSGNATGTPWGALNVNGIIDGDFVYSDNAKTKLTAYIGNGGNVVIPNSVTSIGGYAFKGCSGLISVTIPNSVTSIGNSAFWGCSSLKSVIIPNSVTSIDFGAFAYCSGLTTVIIPNSVTSIGGQAFYLSSGLTIAYDGTRYFTIGQGCFAGCYLDKICVPENYSSNSLGNFSVCKGLVHDNAKEPTCTETGLTEGVHCSNCGRVFVAQEVVPINSSNHNYTLTYAWAEDGSTCTATAICQRDESHTATENATITSAVTTAATCEGDGTTTYTATFENELFSTQTKAVVDIAATGHTAAEAVAENYAAPTCTAAGAVDSVVYCTTCKSELNRKTVEIAATGHNEVVDVALAATCTAAGKTEGKHCSACNEILVAPTDIPALGHDFAKYTYNNDATTEADGTETAACEHGCGTTDTRTAAGTKIATTPEKGTAVTETAASNVNIYAQGRTIVVENATEGISVYNAMGALVCRDAIHRVRTEINVRTAGIYIVRVGNTVKRVMVND